MIGLDTTALIDFFKNKESIKKLLSNIDEPIVLNQIVYSELILGLNPENPNHKREEEFYDNLFNYFINFNLSFSSCKKAREILFILKKKGKIIEDTDCLIAGILLNNGVNKIITKNVKHFQEINGLKVISY